MAANIRAGRAFVEMALTGREKFKAELQRVSASMKRFGNQVKSVGTSLLRVGAATATPFALAIKQASDMEETMNKFNVVFGKSAESVKKWGDEFAGQVGRSKQQVASFLAEAQDLLVPIGFDAGSAEQMSKQLTTLAVDLASFNNMADADVMRDLKAALTGSGEVMKKYGVIVSEAAVKQEMLNQGLDPKVATEQQKATARLAIIMRGTTAAQGDAIRSAGSFANQMKALRASVSNAAGETGSVLLPIVTPMITKVAEGAKIVAAFVQQNAGVVKVVAAVAVGLVAAGAVFLTVGTLITAASTAAAGFATALSVIGAIAGVLVSPFGILAGILAALTIKLLFFTKFGAKALDWLKSKFESLRKKILKVAGIDFDGSKLGATSGGPDKADLEQIAQAEKDAAKARLESAQELKDAMEIAAKERESAAKQKELDALKNAGFEGSGPGAITQGLGLNVENTLGTFSSKVASMLAKPKEEEKDAVGELRKIAKSTKALEKRAKDGGLRFA